MKMNVDESLKRLRTASPLEVPELLKEIEFYNQESAYELFDRVNADFQKDGIFENVLQPVFLSIIDGLLMMPCMEDVSQKTGLTASRLFQECKDFHYGQVSTKKQTDSLLEYQRQKLSNEDWAQENRAEYSRGLYADQAKMNKYKESKANETATKNMVDEYTGQKNISQFRNNPDKRRNDPKNLHNAETDHVVPLRTIFDEFQNNAGLSDYDICQIANIDENFAVTSREINNAKRKLSNEEFIQKQDKLKAEGKDYVYLDERARENMLNLSERPKSYMEKEANNRVLRNLSGKAEVGSIELKNAVKEREKSLNRKLTSEEKTKLNVQLSHDKTKAVYEHLGKDGVLSLFKLLGDILIDLIKPLFYELKDGMFNGFAEGVNLKTIKEALAFRLKRIKDYLLSKLNLASALSEGWVIVKEFISAVLESLLNMFVGVFKKIFRVLKEGVKIFTQAYPVLFGKDADKYTTNEKGDALIKIIGGSVIAICGIALDSFFDQLTSIPESIRHILSTIITGSASAVFFYALDRADLFNVKEEKRRARIAEVFEERKKEIEADAEKARQGVLQLLDLQLQTQQQLTLRMHQNMERGDLESVDKALTDYSAFMGISLPYKDENEFKKLDKEGLINWNL